MAGLLAFAPTAHAQDTNALQSIAPLDGASLDTSPTEIVLAFQQELSDDDNPIITLACSNLPQNTGQPEIDDDRLVVTVPINTPVPRGACTITWRLADVNGDTIIDGFTTFRVDADPVTTPLNPAIAGSTPTTTSPFIQVTTPPASADASTDTAAAQGSSGGAMWLGRLLSTLGILALFGGLALIALGWPEGPEYVVTVRYLRAMWLLALLGTVLYLIAYAARFDDISFGAAMSPDKWLDLKDDGWPGRGALMRLFLVAGSGWVAMRPERIIDPTTAMWAWGLPGASIVAVSLSRVEGPAAWLGVLIGLAHLLTSAIWFGGVALVARVVLAGPGEEDLVHATRAYSRMSTKAMVAVVFTGLIQTLRIVGNPFGSSHGRVLLLKFVAVVAMFAVGLAARQQVTLRLDRAHEMTVPLADRFRRAFGAEAAIGVVVLAFSGWMLSLTPAKVDPLGSESYPLPAIPFSDPTGTGLEAKVFIGPGRVGLNGFKIEVDAPAEGITNLSLRFIPPEGSNLGPILQTVPLTTAGTAVLKAAEGLPLNAPGTWTLEVTASTATATLPGALQTFLVVNADGSQLSVPSQPTLPSPSVVVSEVQQSTTTAPFVTTTLAPVVVTSAPAG